MSKVGVWIETGEDGVKEANFGVITAARSGGNAEIYAFVIAAGVDDYKETLQAYGAQKVVGLKVDGDDLASSPDMQAAALVEAIRHFEITAFLGLSLSLIHI